MSRRANPKIVGGFVLSAIGLLVAAALVFGSFGGNTKSGCLFRGIGGRPNARLGRPLSRGSAWQGYRRRNPL
jgi:hypothetical protein